MRRVPVVGASAEARPARVRFHLCLACHDRVGADAHTRYWLRPPAHLHPVEAVSGGHADRHGGWRRLNLVVCFARYHKVSLKSRLTGFNVVKLILRQSGLEAVTFFMKIS